MMMLVTYDFQGVAASPLISFLILAFQLLDVNTFWMHFFASAEFKSGVPDKKILIWPTEFCPDAYLILGGGNVGC